MNWIRLAVAAMLAVATTPATLGRSEGARAPPEAVRGCGDFLAEMGRRPAHLSYIGCSYFPDRQGKPLRATYRTPGARAVETEAFLAKNFGLTPLTRSCCQWDSPARSFKDARGREFSIAMISEETNVADRAQWPEIGGFEIVVDTFTEPI